MTHSSDKRKIAILGGGIGALTTAFELTEQDPAGTAYDITVYTLGWRLGGKAAVGRDPQGRATEHGLHVWAGFYDNAFDLVQRLHSRLGETEDRWRAFFEPVNHFTVTEFLDGAFRPWLLTAAPNGLDPGIDGPRNLAPLTLFLGVLSILETLQSSDDFAGPVSATAQSDAAARIAHLYPGRTLAPDETALAVVRKAAAGRKAAATDRTRLVRTLAVSRDQALAHVRSKGSDNARRLGILLDLCYALATGLLGDDLFEHGFDSIDTIEWSKWMANNGCRPESLKSAIVRGCYDYVFARGTGRMAGIGAGTATLSLLRLLLQYKGSIFYALREPMGDFLIAPLYRLLKARGVRFEFFHRVKALVLAKDRPVVEAIVMGRQVDLAGGATEYLPLVTRLSDGRLTWPAAPIAKQIVGGDRLLDYDLESAWTDWRDAGERTLRLRSKLNAPGDDRDVFDIAVLAMGFGGLEFVCQDFADRFPKTWGACFRSVQTRQTLALQLWLYPETEALGWSDPETILTAFETPGENIARSVLESWEDNTRLLQLEAPREAGKNPRSLAYFVGEFPDADSIPDPRPEPEFPIKEKARARQFIVDWMNNRLNSLWPSSGTKGGFQWDLLEAPDDVVGDLRLGNQFWRTNINPWDRYVLSTPGSVQTRLWPDRSGVDNLFLAGDWVRSGVNAGCIEAAVIGGRMAARAITGANMFVPGDGNDAEFHIPISALPLVRALRQLKDRGAGGVGLMEACCATLKLPVADVEKKLPVGLRLVPVPQPREFVRDHDWKGTHPVILMFTSQRNVRPGFAPFGGLRYHEFIELIPYVEHVDLSAPSGGPFSYMPYLILDEWLAVQVGVNLYGFNKRLGRVATNSLGFDIRSDLGQIRSQFTNASLLGGIEDIPGGDAFCRLVEHPFVAQTSTGRWVYSYLNFCLDTAEFRKVGGEIRIGEPFVPNASKEYEPIPNYYPWLRFSTRWILSIPLVSDDTSRSIVPQDLATWVPKVRRAASGAKGGFTRLR